MIFCDIFKCFTLRVATGQCGLGNKMSVTICESLKLNPHWPGYFKLLKTFVSKNIKKSKKIACSHGCSPCACRGHLFEGCCRGRWGSCTSTRNPCRRVSSSGEPGWNKLAIFHRKGIELSPSQFSPCRTTLAGHWRRNW